MIASSSDNTLRKDAPNAAAMVQTRRQSHIAAGDIPASPHYSESRPQLSPAKTNTSVSSWADSHGTGNRTGAWGLKGSLGDALSVAGTLFIIGVTPIFAVIMTFTYIHLDASLLALWKYIQLEGLWGLYAAWPRPSLDAWLHIIVFGALQAALQLLLPGREHKGPITPKGNVPVYKANGVLAYFVTLGLFALSWSVGIFNPGHVYDLLPEIIAALNIFSLAFCAFLYIKGTMSPSSSDSGSTGSIIFDFYWGMELYPRIGDSFDLKIWTNCRMGMMSWAVLILCYAVKQHQLYGTVSDSMVVSVALMELYVFKFFTWETGYWGTMDIMHDRAGYYICWGCLVWVPSVYTSPGLFLTAHPVRLGGPLAGAIFLAGVAAIYINWDSDRQRQVFRETSGQALVWGDKPQKITAHYTTGDGSSKTSLLLASGWWGLSRHFHYVPEITAAFLWTVPALFTHILPYFYVTFLTLLLTDRAFRDDERCRAKYGKYWAKYSALVPYKMIPYVW